MLNWLLNWRLNQEAKAHQKELDAMIEVITSHGMKVHKYLPAVGLQDNKELYLALDWLANHGFIITDKQGAIVGKVATANMDRGELVELRRSQIKLVKTDTGSD